MKAKHHSPAIPIQPLIIDDFCDGDFSTALADRHENSIEDSQTGTMLGGHRHIWLHLIKNSYGNQASARVACGAFSFNNDAGVYSELDLSYGWVNGKLNSLHADLTPFTKFRLQFNTNDVPVNLVVLLYSGGGAFYAEGWVDGNLHPSNGPQVAVLDFSSFVVAFPTQFKWNDIDLIVFRFQRANGAGNGEAFFGSDFSIDSIEADIS